MDAIQGYRRVVKGNLSTKRTISQPIERHGLASADFHRNRHPPPRETPERHQSHGEPTSYMTIPTTTTTPTTASLRRRDSLSDVSQHHTWPTITCTHRTVGRSPSTQHHHTHSCTRYPAPRAGEHLTLTFRRTDVEALGRSGVQSFGPRRRSVRRLAGRTSPRPRT